MSHRLHTPEQVAEIVTKYRDGASLPQLAREYGGSHVTIRNVLKREGVERREFKNRPWRSFTEAQQAEIIRRWHAGESQTAIAKDFATAQTVISRFLVVNGIEPELGRRKIQRGDLNPFWRGGVISIQGYRAIKVGNDDPMACMRYDNGYVMEHRLVMGRHLGRPLSSDENVHHVNGNRTDNRLENLELWTRSQPNGQRAADLLAWAREIVARYEHEERLLLP
jgi:hypothetical protein